MSLYLDEKKELFTGTFTKAIPGKIIIGDEVVTNKDFCELVKYVLSNTDLTQNDPREHLVKEICDIKRVEGWEGEGTTRFSI